MIDVVQISKNVLTRLSAMDYELKGQHFKEQVIFPNKKQAKGDIIRISEQELRLLFIEEFKKFYPELFFSIETPTVDKFSFGKCYETIKTNSEGQSASLDMCIFEKASGKYNRILNIEFKHKSSLTTIGKDILKLLKETQDGTFIHLFDNTNSGTFCNDNETGIFNVLYKTFFDFQSNWSGIDKTIQLIIISLKQKTFIHRNINKTELIKLKDIFFVNSGCGNIKEITGNGWEIEKIISEKLFE
jgi:hypothetical protein